MGKAEAVAVFPKVAGFEDAGGGDDAGDEFGWCDVETGIAGAATIRERNLSGVRLPFTLPFSELPP